jgi:hypothetical protein
VTPFRAERSECKPSVVEALSGRIETTNFKIFLISSQPVGLDTALVYDASVRQKSAAYSTNGLLWK